MRRQHSPWTLPRRRRIDGRSALFGGLLAVAAIAITQSAAGVDGWAIATLGALACAVIVLVGDL
jgi:hypothetical protein